MDKLGYIPGKSIIHRLYPLTKFTWLLIVSVLVFFINNGVLAFSLAVVFFLILLAINPEIWKVRGLRLTLITGAALFFMYLLFEKSGVPIFSSKIRLLTFTTGGLESGLLISGRFWTTVFLSYIFILSTDPNHLAYALMKCGLSYRYGFMLVTALRLAPLMEDEGRTIYKAQLVRGIQYDVRSIRKKFLIIKQYLSPLLLSAIRRADKLFFSLEGRGFGKYPARTFRADTYPSILDVTASIILILFLTCIFYLNFRVLNFT